MSTAAEKLKAKRARRPIYLVVRRLVDPTTGEEIGALVPANHIDARLLRERRFTVGREIRAELKQSRNVRFHRLAHAVGNLLVDHVEGFESLSAHEALKRVQREAGVCCEQQMVDMGVIRFGEMAVPVGMVPVTVARSLAFDEMDETEFREFFTGVCAYIDAHYMHGLTDDVRGDYLLMTEGTERRVA